MRSLSVLTAPNQDATQTVAETLAYFQKHLRELLPDGLTLKAVGLPYTYIDLLLQTNAAEEASRLASLDSQLAMAAWAGNPNDGLMPAIAALELVTHIGGWQLLPPPCRYNIARHSGIAYMRNGQFAQAFGLFAVALDVVDTDIARANRALEERQFMAYATGIAQRMAHCALMQGHFEVAWRYLGALSVLEI